MRLTKNQRPNPPRHQLPRLNLPSKSEFSLFLLQLDDPKEVKDKTYSPYFYRAASGPRLRIVDGKVQVDEESLFVHQGDSSLNAANMEVVDESTGRHITNASFRRNPIVRFKWSADTTAMFYKVPWFLIPQ